MLILMVNKQKYFTSYDVVKKFKHVLNYNKIGHAGTLDYSANGLIILFIGNSEIIKNFFKKKKRYIAFCILGLSSNTLDVDGKIKFYEKKKYFLKKNIIKYNLLLIKNKKLFNKPPIFSSIKHNGIRLYKYARFNIKIKLKVRKNNIYFANFIKKKHNLIILDIKCESGTYVRSFINFLGKKIHIPVCISVICRVSIGKLNILNSFF